MNFNVVNTGVNFGLDARNVRSEHATCVRACVHTHTHTHTHTHRQQGDFISLLLFFQNEESRLKKGGELNKSCILFQDLLLYIILGLCIIRALPLQICTSAMLLLVIGN
jgi:hypothetical protein